MSRPNPLYEKQKLNLTRVNTQSNQFSVHEAFFNLKANLLNRCAETNIKSILFNGICHGTGCSTTSSNFAKSLAIDSICKVLLVDLSLSLPIYDSACHHTRLANISSDTTDSKDMVSQIEKIGPENLHMISCGANSLCGPAGRFDSSDFDRFLSSIYNNYDYLILDVPPVQIYSDFRNLCSRIDGVVLVIESGKARRQVALRAKKEIEDAGGLILGVVINRRKYYIPKWIYKRL